MKILHVFVFVFLSSKTICNASSSYVCDKNTIPCGCGPKDVDQSTRIIIGENAIPYSWPMIVSLRINSTEPKHHCGGTILNESYILTAAHCVSSVYSGEIYENLIIAAGIHNLSESNQIIRNVDKIIIHPLWEKLRTEVQYDIAILHLAEPLDLSVNSSLSRTCLPPLEDTLENIMEYPLNGTRLVIIGWGASQWFGSSTEILQQVTVQAIHHFDRKCSKTIRNPAMHLCAGLYQGGKGKEKSDFMKIKI